MKIFKSIYNQKKYYFDWDFDFKCNYRCSYCYQIEENILNKKIKNHKEKIDLVLDFLKDKNFTLGLLGGEPTVSKYYFYILEKLLPILEKNNSEVYISTNFSQSEKFYKNHLKLKNIHYWISIHPEYFNTKSLSYIKYVREFTNGDIILSPMLYKDKSNKTFKAFQIFKEVKNFYFENKDKLKLKYAPQYIFKNQFNLQYFNEFKDFDFSEKEFLYNNKKIEYNKLLRNKKLLNFKNWRCNANYFYIKEEFISNECLNFLEKITTDLKLPNTLTICKRNFCIDYPQLLSQKQI